ncbi:MAG TPA: polysaccharide deacetylase family protein [Mycobacterium sp.]|jgi:peptidoglycan/xylan/chitin deacetylase (PgdA/CDA1 family)|nr:polysaccharide deacetylase family protein [Mycobacterium sp.]
MTASTAEGSSKSAEMTRIPLVLMYHSIAEYDEDPFEVTLTPQRFERQMRWLRSRGLRGVSMGQLLDATADGRARRMVGLTFDDGYADFVPNAMPILRRYGFSATMFVLAGRLGGDNAWSRPGPCKPLLTADQVREIAHAGTEVASHGLEHVSLLQADDARLRDETVRSRAILQELLGEPIRGFAYPYGHSDARVVEAVRTAGYDYACAVQPWSGIGRHAIPRTSAFEHDSSWRLDAKRIVSTLTVGNRIGVRRYREGGKCAS